MKVVTLLASQVDFLGWLFWFVPHPDCILSVFPSFLPLETKTFQDTKFLGGHILSYPRTTPIHQPPRAWPELTKPQVSLLLPGHRPRPMRTPQVHPQNTSSAPAWKRVFSAPKAQHGEKNRFTASSSPLRVSTTDGGLCHVWCDPFPSGDLSYFVLVVVRVFTSLYVAKSVSLSLCDFFCHFIVNK